LGARLAVTCHHRIFPRRKRKAGMGKVRRYVDHEHVRWGWQRARIEEPPSGEILIEREHRVMIALRARRSIAKRCWPRHRTYAAKALECDAIQPVSAFSKTSGSCLRKRWPRHGLTSRKRLDRADDRLKRHLELVIAREPPDPDPHRVVARALTEPDRLQHMAWLWDTRCAGRASRQRDVGLQAYRQLFCIDVGENQAKCAGVTNLTIAVQRKAWNRSA